MYYGIRVRINDKIPVDNTYNNNVSKYMFDDDNINLRFCYGMINKADLDILDLKYGKMYNKSDYLNYGVYCNSIIKEVFESLYTKGGSIDLIALNEKNAVFTSKAIVEIILEDPFVNVSSSDDFYEVINSFRVNKNGEGEYGLYNLGKEKVIETFKFNPKRKIKNKQLKLEDFAEYVNIMNKLATKYNLLID